jgi:hypothetical protein
MEAPQNKRLRADGPSLMLLEARNPHPRDLLVRFDEGAHRYYVRDQVMPQSVSDFWGSFFEHFDAMGVIRARFNRWKTDKESPYFRLIQYLTVTRGLSESLAQAEIARTWRLHGNACASHGTSLHKAIELFLNELPVPADTPEPEFSRFQSWYADAKAYLGQPYRTEWSLWSDEAALAGQLDSLFLHPENGFTMVDWKCVEHLPPAPGPWKPRFGKPPFGFLRDNNLSHYILQQNFYAWFLRTYYGIRVQRMLLLQAHATLDKAVEHEVPDLTEQVDAVMARRCEQVARHEVRFPVRKSLAEASCLECEQLRLLLHELLLVDNDAIETEQEDLSAQEGLFKEQL